MPEQVRRPWCLLRSASDALAEWRPSSSSWSVWQRSGGQSLSGNKAKFTTERASDFGALAALCTGRSSACAAAAMAASRHRMHARYLAMAAVSCALPLQLPERLRRASAHLAGK